MTTFGYILAGLSALTIFVLGCWYGNYRTEKRDYDAQMEKARMYRNSPEQLDSEKDRRNDYKS